MGEDVRWKGEILGCPYLCIMCGRGCKLEGVSPGQSLPLHNVWERMYAGGGESLPLHNVGEDVRWMVEILGRPYLCIMCGRGCTLEGVSPGHLYLCIMCGRGCTLEGGNPGVSLPLHNVWERMYTGGGKSWGVPTSA